MRVVEGGGCATVESDSEGWMACVEGGRGREREDMKAWRYNPHHT